MLKLRDGPLEKLWGGGGIFEQQDFFLSSNSWYEFFFRPKHGYFSGLIGVHKFFSFNFPVREYIFLVLRGGGGGGGNFEQQDFFFFSSNSWYEFFLDRSMNIFQG